MTESQKRQVRELLEGALAREAAEEQTLAALFYSQLFKVAPKTRALFHNRLCVQEVKFTQMLEALREGLDRLDNLVPILWQSGRNHKLYGAQSAHYVVVGDVLLWALEQRQAPVPLTEETREAWQAFYSLVCLIMQEASQAA
ncbi:globin domain-containing protein [Armatimonas sp.]|uniref:globin domain-containing protein n=1 Tax=Armatimonas sp. TaxID=1872638 RepID=UPI00286BB5A4|nr:globin domain-containing protein [Armatimonas sp.]